MSESGSPVPFQLVIESSGQRFTLEAWMYWVEENINSLISARHELAAARDDLTIALRRTRLQSAELRDELTRAQAELRDELTRAQAELRETRALAQQSQPGGADIVSRLDDIDHRLNDVLARFTEQLGGGQTEQGMLHYVHATEFVSLIEQGIPALTRAYFNVVRGGSARAKAEFASYVCELLFASPEVGEQQLVDWLLHAGAHVVVPQAAQVCADARTLRGKVAEGRPQRWDFGSVIGAPLDPDRQLAWTGSEEDGVVAFVVAPAYVVDADALVEKQRVFIVPATDFDHAPTDSPSGNTSNNGGAAGQDPPIM